MQLSWAHPSSKCLLFKFNFYSSHFRAKNQKMYLHIIFTIYNATIQLPTEIMVFMSDGTIACVQSSLLLDLLKAFV